MSTQRLWILKSKGNKSAFGGNSGYADKLESCYVYNTTVKNHDKIKAGDYIVIVDKKYIKGVATVEKINITKDVPKKRYRCPECGTQEHYSRLSVTPRYKCRKKHEFEVPDEENIIVDEFEATYSSSFIKAVPKTSVKLLDKYYINRNIYYSIQQAKVDLIQDIYPNAFKPGVTPVPVPHNVTAPTAPYLPSVTDSRDYRTLKSSIRPKQDKFRNELIKTYGPMCMLTGCNVLIALEASHICPYRGEKDNHIENGILLRRDLHALYDADLIGIDPETLTIFLDPGLSTSCYKEFAGTSLKFPCSGVRPSYKALEIRWLAFLQSSHIAAETCLL
jgi:hypothetical protein